MRVTFWGVRGSCPTPGPKTVRYGGNTSCIEVRLADGTVLIVDAGTGIRALGKRLLDEGLKEPLHLLLTHVHWDHIIGMPFFAPIYRPETKLVLHPLMMESSTQMLSYSEIFDGQHFPVRMHQLPCTLVRPRPIAATWRIGSALVSRVGLNHPGGSTGFRIDDADGSSMAVLTDNELVPPGERLTSTEELAEFARGCGLVVHDAQYLDEDLPLKHGWGHSTVAQVLELGLKAEARLLALYHHEPERDDDALDAIARLSESWWQAHAKGGGVIVAHEGLSLDVPA